MRQNCGEGAHELYLSARVRKPRGSQGSQKSRPPFTNREAHTPPRKLWISGQYSHIQRYFENQTTKSLVKAANKKGVFKTGDKSSGGNLMA
ncbi:hypothetical protein NN561_003794 [Cricetulus griseus]